MIKTKHTLRHAISHYRRNFFCAIAIAAGGHASALSIGEPQTLSYLSEPLQVHLAVSEWLGVPQPEQFRLRLLPNQAYAAYGLTVPQDRPDDLSVRWQRDSVSTAPYVVIQTQSPVTEPILTLLLELRSGQQVMVRQIDLLLDLPPNQPPPHDLVSAPPRKNMAPVVRKNAQLYGPVRPGESLSKIAQRVRPDRNISLDRVAGALMAANPDAFFGDAHELKAGVLLRIPNAQDIRRSAPVDNLLSDPQPAPRGQARSAGNKATPKAFLPSAIYTRGRLWALTMEFPSYETVRPVDLAPTLAALEAAEPILFKADWTLSTATKTPRDVAVSTRSQASAKPPPAPPKPEVSPVVETPPPKQAPTPQQAEVPIAAPKQTTQPAQPVAMPLDKVNANPQPPQEVGSSGFPFWAGLLGVLSVIGFVLWRRQRTAPAPSSPTQRPPPTASSSGQTAMPSAHQLRSTARLRKRIASTLRSSDPDHQRQAQVAQALLERGRFDQAEQVMDSLTQAPTGESGLAKSQDVIQQTDETPYTSDLEPTDLQPSEFEQRRLQDQISKLRRKGLPSDSQRQLKVAEAFFERGNVAQAKTILSGLKLSSDD